ncbi:MAG TPA: hypothetical protein VHX60_09145 [Acidobacteriaceae bacterium]|jgi:hypothetical protein|nr:hypothetical protein [Acidobacteriaceae bacterium]
MPFRKCLWLAGITLAAFSAAGFGQSNDAHAALQQKLIDSCPLTTTTADRGDIVTAGSVVVLQKDGLMMYATNSPQPPLNTFRNGKISQGMSGFGRDLGITMLSGGKATANDYPKQTYVTGQKLWVTGISVNKDNISFVLYTDPDANNLRYYGQLNFPFNKNNLPTPDDAAKLIGEALTIPPPDNAAATPQPASPAPIPPPAAPTDAAGQPGASTMAPIAAPPPPSDAPAAPPKTIALGQTKDQVTAILGQPQKVVNLGAKEIDYYPDMKVVYTHGKVTDVQ